MKALVTLFALMMISLPAGAQSVAQPQGPIKVLTIQLPDHTTMWVSAEWFQEGQTAGAGEIVHAKTDSTLTTYLASIGLTPGAAYLVTMIDIEDHEISAPGTMWY